jgi:hypothetical protein
MGCAICLDAHGISLGVSGDAVARSRLVPCAIAQKFFRGCRGAALSVHEKVDSNQLNGHGGKCSMKGAAGAGFSVPDRHAYSRVRVLPYALGSS